MLLSIRASSLELRQFTKHHNISSKFWTDVDVEYDLGLTKYGFDVEDLQHPLAPARFFCGWIEDWEVPLLKKNDQGCETPQPCLG
jgi:hypothetical protein